MFNLAGANTTVGNTWTIVSATTKSFSGTFTVAMAGAIESANVWDFTNAGTQYQFTESTGALMVVPEPGALGLLLVGALGFVSRRRRA